MRVCITYLRPLPFPRLDLESRLLFGGDELVHSSGSDLRLDFGDCGICVSCDH